MSGLGTLMGPFDPTGLMPIGKSSLGFGVSGDGSVAVGYSNSPEGNWEAFRSENGLMQGLGGLTQPIDARGFGSFANGVSQDGSVVVGSSLTGPSASFSEAFRWTQEGGMVGLGVLDPGTSSAALAVSGDGSVVVGEGKKDGSPKAFRWTTESGMVSLGTLGGGNSFAFDISEDGTTIVGSAGSGPGRSEGFIWTETGGMVGLGNSSAALAVSGDGSTVTGSEDVRVLNNLGIWDVRNGWRNLEATLIDFGLDLTGWTIGAGGRAFISDDGLTFAGTGVNPDGFSEAWIASIDTSPPPTPINGAIANANFQTGNLSSWNVSGPGSATAVGTGGGNFSAQLTAGSPVSLSQDILTLSDPFALSFDYLFQTTTGEMTISLGSELLGTISAPSSLASDFSNFSFSVTDPSLFGIVAPLNFTLDGLTGDQIWLDNVAMNLTTDTTTAPVPEPGTWVLMSSGLIGLGVFRKKFQRVN